MKFKVKLEEIEEMVKCFKQNRRCALHFDGKLSKFIKKRITRELRVSAGRESTKRDDETQKPSCAPIIKPSIYSTHAQ